MKRCILILTCICVAGAFAQQDTVKGPWKHALVAGLTLTQVSFSNWAQGGQNALAYTFSAVGQSVYDTTRISWATSYNFAFGQARLSDQGLRKTDDKIDLGTILTYKVGAYINPYFAATLKSQFAKGYVYDAAGNSTEVSAFFDPGYLTQTVGVGYQPAPEFKTRLGAGLREIFAPTFTAYAGGKKSDVEGGLESVSELAWKVDDNVLLTSKLELFDPFKTMDEVVVRNDNTLAAKVSKYVTVNFDVQLINEKKVTPRTQAKQTLALGISYAIL